MSTVQTEQVMVVKTELFRSCGYFQGFSNETEKYLITLLDPANTQYLPRGDMEEDPRFNESLMKKLLSIRRSLKSALE
jgi:predicted NUDIX family phosphoesterase